MFKRLLAVLAFIFIRIYCKLLKYVYINRHHSVMAAEEGKQILYAFYHGKQLMLLGYPVPKPMVQMVSLSKDGELQKEILHYLGFTVVRGSQGKNGREALFEMVEFVLSGVHGALAIDGSRGPYGKVKPGIMYLARDSGGVIIPLAAASKKNIVLKNTWDKYEIPLPFTKTVVIEGEAIEIDGEIDDPELEYERQKLEITLKELHAQAVSLAEGEDEEEKDELDSKITSEEK